LSILSYVLRGGLQVAWCRDLTDLFMSGIVYYTPCWAVWLGDRLNISPQHLKVKFIPNVFNEKEVIHQPTVEIFFPVARLE
jgi:hypothetical protein